MAETFCGKRCESCEEKLAMRCEGCKKPWGKPMNGDCEIAVCCSGKNHETCETCTFLNNCGKLRERENMVYYRRRKRETEERRSAQWRETITERVGLMSKWGTALFWIVILGELCGLFGASTLGNSLAVIISVAYGAALLQMAVLTPAYRTAGICCIAASLVYLVMGSIPARSAAAGWTLLLSIPGSIVALVGDYHEFHAHAEMLANVDDDFAKKWENLWKWNLRMIVIPLCAGLVAVIAPGLGAIAVVAAGMGALVIQVLKIVYLYRMSKIFRSYELPL